MAVAKRPELRRESIPRYLALGLISLTLLLVINQGLYLVEMPALSGSSGTPFDPWGYPALLRVSVLSGAIALVLVLTTSQVAKSLPLAASVFGVFAAVAIGSAISAGGPLRTPLLWGIYSVGLLASGVALGPNFLRKLALWVGGIWCWASVLVGLLSAGGLLPARALDSGERYGQWLSRITGQSSTFEVSALLGLGSGRQILGAAAALLLVIQLIVLMSPDFEARLHLWLAPLGALTALVWSMSRTGLLAAALGLVFAFLPWQRMSASRARKVLALVLVFLVTVPLFALFGYTAGNPQGTWQWRLEVWHDILLRLRELPAFGIQGALTNTAGHAHNLLMEVASLAGLVGVAGLIYFVWKSSEVAVAAARNGCPVVLGGLVTFFVVGQTEMPINFRGTAFTATWPILILLLAAGTAWSQQRNDFNTASSISESGARDSAAITPPSVPAGHI